MMHVLELRGIHFQTELRIPIEYRGLQLEADLRCDLLVENTLVVELQSVNSIALIHIAQLLTNMKLLNQPMGLMINFIVLIFSRKVKKLTSVNYMKEFFKTIDLNETYIP